MKSRVLIGVFFVLNFGIVGSASALLEFPSSLTGGYENNTNPPANTSSTFFQNLLKKINFGNVFNTSDSSANTQTTSTQNPTTQTGDSSVYSPGSLDTTGYDAEYQKILEQNLGKNGVINLNSKPTTDKNTITPSTLGVTSEVSSTNKLLTREEVLKRLDDFIKTLNQKQASTASSQTSTTSAAPNLTQAQQDAYFAQTGKTWSAQDYQQKNANYFTPEQAAAYSTDPYISKIYNPAVRSDFSSPYTPVQNGINIMMNPGSFTGAVGSLGELDSRLFKVLGGGWLETKASNFGLNTNGSPDTVIKPQYGCKTAMSSLSATGPITVCNTSTCVVSLPREVINYYYGKVDWKDSRSIYAKYKQIAGSRIEVYNYENGTCAVAPLWEIGPGHQESLRNGFGIDLTYCVKVNMLETKSGAPKVKYRPVPSGKEGCEDYPAKRKVAPTITKK